MSLKEENRKEPEKGKGAESGEWSSNMALSHSLCLRAGANPGGSQKNSQNSAEKKKWN